MMKRQDGPAYKQCQGNDHDASLPGIGDPQPIDTGAEPTIGNTKVRAARSNHS
jgi:hypothetical protein